MKARKDDFIPPDSFVPEAVVANPATVPPQPKRSRRREAIAKQQMYANQQLAIANTVNNFDIELIHRWLQQKAPRQRRASWLLAKQFQTFVDKPLAQVTLTDVRAFANERALKETSPHPAQRLLAVKSLLTFGYHMGVLPMNIAEHQWPKIRQKKQPANKNPRRSFGLGLGVGACVFGIALIVPGWLWKAQQNRPTLNAIAEDWQDPMMSAQMLELYAQTEAALKSANIKAFLDTIAKAEGTSGPDGYRTQYTGEKFASYSAHPDTVKCANSYGQPLCSSAAGRYQFLKPTYDRLKLKLGLRDFSPRSQDLAAVELLREQGALNDIESGNIKAALQKVAPIWVHIEGAGYGQPEYPLDKLEETYWQERKKYK